MSFQVEAFIWMMVGLVPAMGIAFYLASVALKWKKQRDEAWIEWRGILLLLNSLNDGAFANSVTAPDGTDEGTITAWAMIEDSRFRYERASGKQFFFRSYATTSRFGSDRV